MLQWYEVREEQSLETPSLLVYPRRIEKNIDKLKQLVGDSDRLRPHIKTIKSERIINLLLQNGITKLKCSTIAEAELCAIAGTEDILIAYQPVGPNVERLFQLINKYPNTEFSTVVDNSSTIETMDRIGSAGNKVDIYIDLDVGMHRTGISDPDLILELAKSIISSKTLKLAGLHIYDGHIHDDDLTIRTRKCEESEILIDSIVHKLVEKDIQVQKIIAGGTPTLFHHQSYSDRELGAGTPVLWDYGYKKAYSELEFDISAVIAGRVLSKPNEGLICLDIGYKAIASEMPWPRMHFPQIPEAKFVSHSEEHLVLNIGENDFAIGDLLYGFPVHICPTVALHEQMFVVENHSLIENWSVEARKRKITI